jgi:hypothetical protein
MLCDDLVANGAPGSCMDISSILPVVARAQKFSLSAEFAAVADALSENYAGLVRVFDRCRLPYPETWIECAHAERPNFRAAEMHAPLFQVQPRRIGFLCTATRDDLSAWKTHLFWSCALSNSAAALALQFDMTQPLNADVPPTDEQVKVTRAKTSIVAPNLTDHPGWIAADEFVRRAMIHHTDIVLPDFGIPIASDLPRDKYDEFYSMIFQLARSDWAGEAGYLLAVIGLLNARNATTAEAVDHSKLNHARIKRGRPPLFEHRVLKITHRHMTRPPGSSSDNSYAALRAHMVRGHFKARKTGIFFWHPHVRGDLNLGRIEKQYEIT